MLPLLHSAIARREPLHTGGTDALRLVDGAGDALDGIEIDDFAGRWLVQTRSASFPQWLRAPGLARSIYWKHLAQSRQPPVWIAGERADAPFEVRENGMRLWIDFAAGYSQGVFLDQRDNRAELRRRAPGLRVLNCFAYTCAFGLAAALGGAAETVNIDLSKHYLEWGRRNYALNSLDPAAHRFLSGDVLTWLERFASKDQRFDVIVLDPPTFSRDKEGGVFRVESGFPGLVCGAEAVLSPSGALFCSTNQRSLRPQAFRRLIANGLAKPGRYDFHACRMPPDFPGEQYLKTLWVVRR